MRRRIDVRDDGAFWRIGCPHVDRHEGRRPVHLAGIAPGESLQSAQHVVPLREHERRNRRHADCRRVIDEQAQQRGSDASALPRVFDEDGDLRVRRATRLLQRRQGDHVVTGHGNEGMTAGGGSDDGVEVACGEPRHGCQEAAIAGRRRASLEHRLDGAPIGDASRPQRDRQCAPRASSSTISAAGRSTAERNDCPAHKLIRSGSPAAAAAARSGRVALLISG